MKDELQWLEHFVSTIHVAETVVEIADALQEAFRSLSFDHVQMSIHRRGAREVTTDPDLATRKDNFLEEFNGQRWYERDPVVDQSMKRTKGFWSHTGVNNRDVVKRARDEFMAHFNISTGIVIPLNTRSGLFSSLAATSSRRLVENATSLSKATILARAAAMRLEILGKSVTISADAANGLRQLSAQQLEILKWASEGKSNAAIAIILGLSKAGVDYHVRAIIGKLGVASRTQAALMLKNGAIS